MKKDECIALSTKKILADEQKKIEKQKKKEIKEQKERFKAIKEALDGKKGYTKKLQDNVNEIARLIDYGNPCMMCANPRMKKINGCHYHSVGSNSTLRYHLLNIWHGCEHCNKYKGGNIIGYDTNLIEQFGEEFWKEIKFDLVRENKSINLMTHELKEKVSITNEIIKELKSKKKVYDAYERIELRDKYNKIIGIYR